MSRPVGFLFAALLTTSLFAVPPIPDPPIISGFGDAAFSCATDALTEQRTVIADQWLRARQSSRPLEALSASSSAPRVENSIFVLETTPLSAPFDRAFDLLGSTLIFRRNAGGGFVASREALAYDNVVGTLLPQFHDDGGSTWHVRRHQLQRFTIPFGSRQIDEIFITPWNAIELTAPPVDIFYQYDTLETHSMRRPLIAPLLQTSRNPARLPRPNVFLKEDDQSVTVTWRTPLTSDFAYDVQARLDRNGDISYSYRSVKRSAFGTVVLTTGEEAWRSNRTSLLSADDPIGDVDSRYEAALQPMLDIQRVTMNRIGDSGLIEVRITTRGEIDRQRIPANTTVRYYVSLTDTPADRWRDLVLVDLSPSSHQVYRHVRGWSAGSAIARIEANEIVLHVLQDDLASAAGPLQVSVGSYTPARGYDADNLTRQIVLDAPAFPADMRLSSLGVGVQLDAPIVESFTLSPINVGAVWDQLQAAYGLDPTQIDALAVYQDFPTDIIFYAGAYSTVGNPAVDGIANRSGFGSAHPRRPALLHMNLFDYGWNENAQRSVAVMNHELGHRWLYHFSIMENGLRLRRLNPVSAHPAQFVHMPAAFRVYTDRDASTMGGGSFVDNGNGTFTTASQPGFYGFTWHELYLMGLATPSEVEPWYYIENSSPALGPAYYPPTNTTVSGVRRDVNVQQIIEAMGPRNPDAARSQRDFRVLYVLLTRDGAAVDPATLRTLQEYRLEFERSFRIATGDRASVNTWFGLGPRRRGATPSPPGGHRAITPAATGARELE
jgi:hypothetical protein